MLNGINTSGRYLQVTGGTSSTYINKSYNSNAKMVGDMMYDTDSQCIKVFDGSSWQQLYGGHATVDLTYEAQSLLDWARKKRDEEMLLEKQAQERKLDEIYPVYMTENLFDYEGMDKLAEYAPK